MRIGIYGYGNLGKACEEAIALNPDMKLVAVFTGRNPDDITVKTKSAKVLSRYDVMSCIGKIDVIINCGSSATDLPETTAFLARHFNVVDCFDNNEKINEHFFKVNAAAVENGKVALISAGVEPGILSVMRLYFSAFMPHGKLSTFCDGVSQGHSEVIRHIYGVKDARQYTVPDKTAVENARRYDGETVGQKESHKRVCFVAANEGAYPEEIEYQIKNIPTYFAGYDTQVNFVSEEELSQKHSALCGGGTVISSGFTDVQKENGALMEMKLSAQSSPELTAGIATAYARAVFRAAMRSETGCKTVADIAPAELLPLTENEIRKLI